MACMSMRNRRILYGFEFILLKNKSSVAFLGLFMFFSFPSPLLNLKEGWCLLMIQ